MNSMNPNATDFGPDWRTTYGISEQTYRQLYNSHYGELPTMPDKKMVLGTSIQTESSQTVKDTEDHSHTAETNWREARLGFCMIVGGLALAGAASLGAFASTLAAALCACLYLCAGLARCLGGINRAAGIARRWRKRESHPHEPWLWDADWSPEGNIHSTGGDALRIMSKAFIVTLVVMPFSLIIANRPMPPAVSMLISLFYLLPLAIILFDGYKLLKFCRYGSSSLRWNKFPIHPGDTVKFTLDNAQRLVGATKLYADPRYMEEQLIEVESQSGPTSSVEWWELFNEHMDISTKALSRDKLELIFTLPSGQMTNSLSEQRQFYWDLRIVGELPGVDYRAHFLVPVYARY
jgi:hypothetical protein